jgi:hypothetical protein
MGGEKVIFKHFISTRFNVGLYSNNPYKVADPDKWMKDRIRLFEKYCLPSIQFQTNKNFTWLAGFDPATDPKIMNGYDFIPVIGHPRDYIKSLDPEADWLITSRFDNDDIYDKDFVKRIQAQFDYTTKVIDIHLKSYKESEGVYYAYKRPQPNSPFISLIEKWDKPYTVHRCEHTSMQRHYKTVWLKEILGCQVVHSMNQSNAIRGKRL